MNAPIARVFATTNSKLAAVLLVFGVHLPRVKPGLVAEVFKLSDLRRGFKDPQPPRRVFWNFAPDPNAQLIWAAFQSKTAAVELDQFVETLTLDPEPRAQLKAFQSAALVQACREALEKREQLAIEVHNAPDEALYQAILNDDGSMHAIFPKSASAETKARFFTK